MDEYSKIDADILSILKTACELRKSRIPVTYDMLHRRSGVPRMTIFRYINDPKYGIEVVAKRFGYAVKLYRHKQRGRIIDVVYLGVAKNDPFDTNGIVIDG